MTAFRPADVAELAELVAWGADAHQTFEIIAGGSKRALGRPPRTDHTLDVTAFSGIVDYEPAELVLTAQAATPMASIEARLLDQRQMLAFEPPDWRDLLASAGEPTLGGTIACNLAGPRRIRAGAARDHVLGFSAVNGWGEAWKAGGRVVKNVTGYDMCKLQTGAYGTLSVLTELSVKVLPRPETACTLLLPGLTDDAAFVAMAAALNTPHEVSAAAHLPAAVAARAGLPGVDGAVTALRLEGHRPSVDFRATTMLGLLGGATRLDEVGSIALWRAIAAVQPLIGRRDSIVWRLCPTPSAAPALVFAVIAALPSSEAFYDWGGGLVWLALDPGEAGFDGGASIVRAAVAEAGGHATLIRAAEAIRADVPVFEPAQPALEALTRRVKASFDPDAVLNPGRMQEGV